MRNSFSFHPKRSILASFLADFWYAPQDVLLRSVEANILQTVKMVHPILDIGVGDGGIAPLLYPRKLVIDQGFDVDESGLERAKATGKYKKVTHDDAQKMSFKSGSFATIICNSTCEHITQDRKAIAEMGRVLKKGGVLHLTVPSSYLPGMIKEYERWNGNVHPERELDVFNTRVQHKHYHSLGEWTNILAKAKLKVVYYKYYFPEETTRVWYGLMKWSITKALGREMWSWVGQSRFTPLIPRSLVKWYLENIKLRRAYEISFTTPNDEGGMLYIMAQK